jgi:hypothetical protein
VRPGQGSAQLQVSLAERVSVLKDVVLNFANRRCFADLASKLVVVTIPLDS